MCVTAFRAMIWTLEIDLDNDELVSSERAPTSVDSFAAENQSPNK